MMRAREQRAVLAAAVTLVLGMPAWGLAAEATQPLTIAASPSMKAPVEALGRAFEQTHPHVAVQVFYDSGLDLRRTMATVANDGRFFLGTGPIDLIAPGGDELVARLESKYYVLPGTKRSYAAVPLVLVVPDDLVEAPSSFEEIGKGSALRIAVADQALTELGRQTGRLFEALGIGDDVAGRLDVASDARGVLDHLLLGRADVGVIFGPDAVRERERVRVVATAGRPIVEPTVHSMAMNRYCLNRDHCGQFLAFVQSPEAQAIVRSLGYVAPVDGR